MSVYIYVEGDSEVNALPKILADIYASRRVRKPEAVGGALFKVIGPTVAKLLLDKEDVHAFACPDLAPNKCYLGTKWAYRSYEELQDVLRREVSNELRARTSAERATAALQRFHPHPFRHDFEVVLLGCPERLKRYLRTDKDITKRYSRNPEDQDFDKYPSRVVERLFTEFRRTRYNKGYDPQLILNRFTQPELDAVCDRCPRFASFVAELRAAVAALGG